MVEPHSSNFRVISTNILGVRIFRKFTVYSALITCIDYCILTKNSNQDDSDFYLGHVK